MKKRLSIILTLFFLFTICSYGCGKKELEPVTIPETTVEETVSEKDFVSESTTDSAPSVEVVDDVAVEESISENASIEDASIYPYWWDLYDYHLDQQDLAADSEFKNLTIQPGSKPDELHITWFSKTSSMI